MRVTVLAGSALFLAVAGHVSGARAQMPMETNRLTMEQQIARFENEERRRLLDPTPMDGEQLDGLERMNLARRVVDLMDARQCLAARDLAVEAGEKLMAQRVRRWCRSGEYPERGRRAIARG